MPEISIIALVKINLECIDLEKIGQGVLSKFFKIAENKTTISQEIKAGVVTFLTLSYILFVHPSVMSGRFLGVPTGMDFGALLTGTCIASAIGTLLMAFYARLPIAQAPGMGENFFFVTSLVPAAAVLGTAGHWQTALGAVFIAALIFFLLSVFGIAGRLIDAFSPSMRQGLLVGIGFFITLIGLENSGLIVKNIGTGLELNPHTINADTIVFLFGLLLGAVFHARKYKSYILWAIIGSFVMAVLIRIFATSQIAFAFPAHLFSLPPSLGPVWMQVDFSHVFSIDVLPLVLVLLVLSIFDATGTLIAVTREAGLMKKNKLPEAKKALVSNSLAAMVGTAFGMSTVTSFMESLAGVEQGGKTGLTSLTVGILFLFSLFLFPIIAMIANYPPIIAPALVLVGAIMMRNIKEIDWSDYTEMLPAFLIMVCIPFFFSIANGIGIGLIAYPLIKLFSGKIKELNYLNVSLGLFFALYFILK
ncbi:MAG: NCS2 family permease [Candidatus Melainabacteria bacterium]|nr:NCS2 family permease [Candidatus Melainabacteria bacterium]